MADVIGFLGGLPDPAVRPDLRPLVNAVIARRARSAAPTAGRGDPSRCVRSSPASRRVPARHSTPRTSS